MEPVTDAITSAGPSTTPLSPRFPTAADQALTSSGLLNTTVVAEEYPRDARSASDSSPSSSSPEIDFTATDAAPKSLNTPYLRAVLTVHPHLHPALTYLSHVLARTELFKRQLSHRPCLSSSQQNLYPPVAVIFSRNTPTVSGARVASRSAISLPSANDALEFGAGDGVVLAREAQVSGGYEVVRRGRVRSAKGHISLLADHDAVGRAAAAVLSARAAAVGLGSRRIDSGQSGDSKD